MTAGSRSSPPAPPAPPAPLRSKPFRGEPSFDAAYYERHYESESRVHGPKEIGHLATMITSYIAWLGGELRSVLDVGAGPGLMRDHFRAHLPHVRYRSTEVSSYAAKKYGHERCDISVWCADESFDLIVCQGVLQYLTDEAADRAIAHLGRMAGGFLYLEAITRSDLVNVCDIERTDVAVHARSGSFYRTRLARHFHFVGCGLYYAKSGDLLFYELERGP